MIYHSPKYISLYVVYFCSERLPLADHSQGTKTNCWDRTQNMPGCQSLKSLYPTKIKTMLTKSCISKYQ